MDTFWSKERTSFLHRPRQKNPREVYHICFAIFRRRSITIVLFKLRCKLGLNLIIFPPLAQTAAQP